MVIKTNQLMTYSKGRCLFWDPYKTRNARWAPNRICEC